jgi:hypothetical protein
MARARFAEQSVPATPSSGYGVLWPDSTSPRWFTKDDAGRAWGRSHNAATAAQGAGFSSDTYVTDSDILIPSFGFQAKTTFAWRISASKTAAGVATPIYYVRIGTNRTTADTARLTLTGPAQTAAVDTGILTLVVTVRSVGASGVIQGTANWSHDAAATGFANNDAGTVEGTSAGFDNSALGGSYIGLSINGGTSAAWTLTQVHAEANW